MALDGIKFDTKDVVKLIGFVSISLSMWYDLKTDFAIHKEQVKLLEYRIGKLEEKIDLSSKVAILPRTITIEDEPKGFR